MHGIGNDFVLVNTISEPLPNLNLEEVARQLCNRTYGVGADGLIVATPGVNAPLMMRVFNSDGSESESCGNGLRCFAHFVRQEGITNETRFEIETKGGVRLATVRQDGLVEVDMGPVRFDRGSSHSEGDPNERFLNECITVDRKKFVGSAVAVGNPHFVIFVPDVEEVELGQWGPNIEKLPIFREGVNVHFAQVVHPGLVRQRTWERGSHETLACGSGACAVVAVAQTLGLTGREVEVVLPGGRLMIYYREDSHAIMTGPAEPVFSGQISVTNVISPN